jgi:hypothetical protein
MGGLGLTHTARVSSAAFIGSAEYSCAAVLDLVPVTSCTLGPDIALDPTWAHYHAQFCPEVESPSTLPPAPSQASLTLPLHQGARVSLPSASYLRNKARLQSLTLSQAHAWLLAAPYKPSLQLKPAEFRQAIRYRLGIADHNEEQVGPVCRKCRRSQDPQDAVFVYGDHSTQCHGGGPLHRRHDCLKVVLYTALRSGGYSPQLEPPHLVPGRLTRPGDVYVPVGDNGLGVAWGTCLLRYLCG